MGRDLLTDEEAADRRNVFDIELLAERRALATAWIGQQEDTKSLPIGYFGARTGAAALVAAARLDPEKADRHGRAPGAVLGTRRRGAGAERLLRCKEEPPVVLALPRGGIPVANRTAFVMARGGAAG